MILKRRGGGVTGVSLIGVDSRDAMRSETGITDSPFAIKESKKKNSETLVAGRCEIMGSLSPL